MHCWFCLKLLRICSPFSPFFYSSFYVPDSGVSEQFLWIFLTLALVNITQIQKKNTILLTVASANIFAKNKFEEEIFYIIFFLFILYCYLSFLDGSKKKKKHCTKYLHLTVIVHRLSTSTKNTNTKKKNKTKYEGPANKPTKASNIFGIFCYWKGVHLVKYQIRMGIKIMAKV